MVRVHKTALRTLQTSRQKASSAWGLILFAGWLWTFVHSCSPGVDPNYRRFVDDSEQPHFRPDELGPTDQFEIRVAGEDDLTGEFTVSSSGVIDFPWVGELFVDGKTCTEVASEIRGALEDGYLLNPSVSCQIIEINSRKIDIIGEVSQPGSFVYENNMTILRAIALAQGFTDDAAPNATAVLRVVDGEEMRIRIPVEDIIAGTELNFPLAPGDTVVVPRYQLLP